MSKKTWFFAFGVALLSVLGVSFFFLLKNEKGEGSAGFYVDVALLKVPRSRCPYLEVEIEGRPFSMLLDLGFNGYINLDRRSIDCLDHKSLVGTRTIHNFRGTHYEAKVFEIPKAVVGDFSFKFLPLQEKNPFLSRDTVILKEGAEPSPEEDGALGWKLFRKSNLIINPAHSKISFFDSIQTLAEQGYDLKQFSEAEMLDERGLIEINCKTSDGPLRCLLDTGCSWNILHHDLEEGRTIEEMAWDESLRVKYPSFVIGGRDFGEVEFKPLPVKLPIEIGAVLGMEFFEEHVVILDFGAKKVYVRKVDLSH